MKEFHQYWRQACTHQAKSQAANQRPNFDWIVISTTIGSKSNAKSNESVNLSILLHLAPSSHYEDVSDDVSVDSEKEESIRWA